MVPRDRRLRLALHRLPDPPGAGRSARPAGARRHRAGPALQDAADRQRDPYRQAHPRPRSAGAGSHRLRPEAARGRCLRALQDQRSAAVLPDGQHDRGRQLAALDACSTRRCAACSARRRFTQRGARRAPAADAAHARAARPRGRGLRHRRRRRAHPPRRPAGAEQPGGLPAHADRAPARSGRVPRPGRQRAQEIRAAPTAK